VSNVLNEEKKQQVIALGRLGWSLRRIERETGVRRETAAGYLKTAGISVRFPGAWGRRPPVLSDSKPANGVTTDSASVSSGKPANEVIPDLDPDSKPANEVTPDSGASAPKQTAAASASEPYRELIEQATARGRNAKAIWQDLVDDHGFTGSYQSVKRFINKLRGSGSVQQPCAVIVTAPGEEAQVDYGEGPMVRDPQSGRYRRTRLFVLTLGYSRKCVRLIVFTSSTRLWAEMHETAFGRLGGAPRVLILDNLREGVLKPDIYDPVINPLYRDMLAHYKAVATPCRIKDPDRKGKVESSVGHAQKTPLKGQRFETLKEAQAYLDRWEEHWADTRIHGTTKRQVAAMFAEENPLCYRSLSSHFATTSTANARFIWMDASKSRRPTTVRHLGGSADESRCSGTGGKFACSIPTPGNCFASICVNRAAHIALFPKTATRRYPSRRSNCFVVRRMPAIGSALSAR
jgi:transposase